MDLYKTTIEVAVALVECAGVLAILLGILIATMRLALGWRASDAYRRYRRDLGGAILLGLEFLVAADIVRTVVVAPTLENVAVLGIIVLIRTFLSFALEVELNGRWPWQSEGSEDSRSPSPKPSN